MTRNSLETILGAIVLLTAALFIVFGYFESGLKPVDGYRLQARFNTADGLSSGSGVRIGGVEVGSVTSLSVSYETYRAVVDLQISPDLKLPVDTQAVIRSDGLFGKKFIKLKPGEQLEYLKHGDEITRTKDAVSLEDLLGQIIFSASGKNADK